MAAVMRYVRLWAALVRFSLIRELAFRMNFLVKIFVEVLWLGILLAFYETIFQQTQAVAGWGRHEYLFFMGCYFAMGGLIETLFLENCNQFADLVRTGELDFYLLKPIDEQFLISCRTFDWSCAANVVMGVGVMLFALIQRGEPVGVVEVTAFLATFMCGAALAYGFLLMLTSASVWFMRNQSLFEMWWLFTTLMRYPKGIFTGSGFAEWTGFVFLFLVPIMLVSNVPSQSMVKLLEPEMIAYMFASTAVVLFVSRRVFRLALQKYRSASS